MQKSIWIYISNTLKNKKSETLSHIIERKIAERRQQEIEDLERIKMLPESSLPSPIFYIPFVNFIGIGSSHTREQFHLRNGMMITLISIILIILFWKNSSVLLFVAFPVFFGIGYAERKAYKMPYIYDIYALYASFIHALGKIFHKTRELKKTDIKQSIKIGETKTPPTQESKVQENSIEKK